MCLHIFRSLADNHCFFSVGHQLMSNHLLWTEVRANLCEYPDVFVLNNSVIPTCADEYRLDIPPEIF